jgi:hypothetical protein
MSLSIEQLEVCRSLLFVRANEQRFISKAHQRGAGAMILDLEDVISPDPEGSRSRHRPGRRCRVAPQWPRPWPGQDHSAPRGGPLAAEGEENLRPAMVAV